MISDTSRRNYAFDWRSFTAWCTSAGRDPLPASEDTVVLFLTYMLSCHRVSTVQRFACAIAHYHRESRLTKPLGTRVTALLAGARRARRERPQQKAPLTIEQLRAIMKRMVKRDSPRDVRDRSMITLGLASALRRSNIAALQVDELARVNEGLVLWIGQEKNHQRGPGRQVAVARGAHIETCPVRALDDWLQLRGTTVGGPLYCRVINGQIQPHLGLRPANVALAVKRAVALIRLDPARYAGHSLRSGFVTAGVLGGLSELAIARQTGHRSLDSLRDYFRATDLWRANPSGLIGL